MLRLSTLKATLFTISKKNKLKVLKIINLLLFITLFALISSGTSIYFERKIDEIEKKNIISEFNNLIYSNQIERTSSNIKFTERILDKYYESESQLHILFAMSSSDLNLFNEREKYYDAYFFLRDRTYINNREIQRSLTDAMMIADNVEEVEKIEKFNDGIDLLSSIKNQKKLKNNNTISNFDDEEIIRFNLIDSKEDTSYYQEIIYSLAEISKRIEEYSPRSIGNIVNIHTGGDGFYKGDMINNLPEGKGKWSNCHKERFSKLDLSKTIETCEIIVGNWKNGTLNGYAKIFYLGSPTKIPDLETLWKDVDINTNFLTTNFSDSILIVEGGDVDYGYYQGTRNKVLTEKDGIIVKLKPQRINTEKKYANIFVGNFQNNVVTDNLSTKITSNRGQMIISSLNEGGNPDGIGVTLYTDGSIIIGIYENGNLNLNNNIIALINTEKKIKTLKSSQMGNYLENYQETFANYKNFIHEALLDNNFIKKSDKKRKTEFKLKATYLREYDKFPNIKQRAWNQMEIPAKFIGKRPPMSDRPIVLGVINTYKYIPFDTDSEVRKSSFSYYRGKISEIRENGQLVYNGRSRKIDYNDKYFSLEEGDFKDGLFVYGFQIYDDGSKPRVNVPLNFKIKVSGQSEKKLDHTAEVYYGSLNEKGPNGEGTMVMPNGMLYIGEWKDNDFHGNGELKKYGDKKQFRNKSNQTIFIPSLKYSLKGNFEDGISQGKMEGYVFDADIDAAGVITGIVKKDISGLYSKGKLVKSSVVKKVEAKKLDRPVFKPTGDPTQAIIQAENLAAKIGCSGYQMDGIFTKFLIYPCASYEAYEKAILKLGEDQKEAILKLGEQKNVKKETKQVSIDHYLNNIKQAGIYGIANYGIGGEEEVFFEGYAFNSSHQNRTKHFENVISERLEERGEVLKLHEVKFTNVLKCKNPNFSTPDLFFVGIDKSIIKKEQTKIVKEKYPKMYSEIPVYHIVRFSENINPTHAETSYITGNNEVFELVTEDIYDWRPSRLIPKEIIIEKVENDTISLVKNFTKFKNWQQKQQYWGKGRIIQQVIKIDLKNSNVTYKHMLFFAGNSTYSWYKPPEQVDYDTKCENISIN